MEECFQKAKEKTEEYQLLRKERMGLLVERAGIREAVCEHAAVCKELTIIFEN